MTLKWWYQVHVDYDSKTRWLVKLYQNSFFLETIACHMFLPNRKRYYRSIGSIIITTVLTATFLFEKEKTRQPDFLTLLRLLEYKRRWSLFVNDRISQEIWIISRPITVLSRDSIMGDFYSWKITCHFYILKLSWVLVGFFDFQTTNELLNTSTSKRKYSFQIYYESVDAIWNIYA